MEKIKIVYNEITRKIIAHSFNKDGTVFITSTGLISQEDEDHIIVSMVDRGRVDFVNGYILEEGECVKEEENS